MSRPEILTVAKLPPFLAQPLNEHFVVHERLHETDPVAFDVVASRIRGIVGGGESKVTAELIARCPALEIVSVMGVGYDGVDVAAARAHGVVVTHTPNVLNDDVADLAMGVMLSVARGLPQADAFVKSGQWANGPFPLQRKLSGSRLGIVGMGRIGQAIATRALAFGMPVAYTARNPRPALAYRFFPSALELAGESDFLVVITPGGAATRKMINADVLKALGTRGYLVNVARGSVVDESALMDALEQGLIAGAALDVFENEPQVPQRLRAMPNVVLTPHIGSATAHTRHAMADLAFNNLRLRLDGQAVLTPVPECA